MTLRQVAATRYAAPLREGGSLPGLVEADDDGLYVTKFRAAGQGPKALVAEIIVGELARGLGLPVPEIVLVDVPEALGRSEPDPEINELVSASTGVNVGLDFLPGALDFTPAHPDAVDPGLAARIVWFDAFVTNVDRSPRNPNLLVWHGRPFLIDHGAALYRHHADVDLLPRARDPFGPIADHVLLAQAGDLAGADAALAPQLDAERIGAAVAQVPDALLDGDRAARRANYVDYLSTRLLEPRAFLASAQAAQRALTDPGRRA